MILQSKTKLIYLGGDAGMWICFDPIGSREGWRAFILFCIFLCWTSFGIDGSLTNAAAFNVPHNTVTSDISLPLSTHHEDDECRNVTTDKASMYYMIILYKIYI